MFGTWNPGTVRSNKTLRCTHSNPKSPINCYPHFLGFTDLAPHVFVIPTYKQFPSARHVIAEVGFLLLPREGLGLCVLPLLWPTCTRLLSEVGGAISEDFEDGTRGQHRGAERATKNTRFWGVLVGNNRKLETPKWRKKPVRIFFYQQLVR